MRLNALAALGLLASCASTSPKEGYAAVSQLVADRGLAAPPWDQRTPASEEIDARIASLLRQPLSPEAAIEIALLRNRGLQATYESVGIAQADLVQAGLLANPRLEFSLGFPLGNSPNAALQGSLAEDFMGLFAIPLRKRFAERDLKRAELRVGSAVVELSVDVRAQFIRLQAAQQTAELLRTIVEADGASAELSKRQHAAGNISELENASRQALYESERIDLARAEAALLDEREALNRLMGLWGNQTSWQITATLPQVPKAELALDHLESRAIANRLDLAAAREQTESIANALSLESGMRVVPMLDLGVTGERDSEGNTLVGPTVGLQLPIFDQGQAKVARLAAQFREAQDRQLQLAVDIRSQVRAARSRLLSTRAVVEHYRRVVLPLRERIVQLSQEHYNGMLLGVYGLVLAKQSEISAYRDYIDSVRDYWLARNELERSIGARLPEACEPSGSNGRAEPPANP